MSEETQETASEEVELSLDDLFNDEIDRETVDKAQKEMLLPVGTYTTTPPFTITKHGKYDDGRRFVRFFGTITMGDHTGRIGLGMSPDYRNAKDFETGEELEKPDSQYKLYVNAEKAFKAAYGREATTVSEVIAYVRDYPVRLRVFQTSSGDNRVANLSAVRS